MRTRVALSVLLLIALAAWGAWLLAMARTPADYAARRAQAAKPVPSCSWVRPDAEGLGSLGLSLSPDLVWTDRTRAYLIVPVPPLPRGADLDIEIVALAARRLEIDADSATSRLRLAGPRLVRIPLQPSAERVVRITFVADDPKPPADGDRRWLGAAIGRLRVCPR